jgi:uncharacterized protein YndB with AHSA1/START domain
VTGPGPLPPLVVEFDVAVSPEHAFDVWTRRTRLWWPPSHTISGNPERIVIEPCAGGHVVEVASSGEEHRWGEVLDWEPPGRLRLLWHLFFDRSEATELEITFRPRGGGTAVRLEQRGWDRLGDAGRPRRERTGQAWSAITGRYALACAAAPPDPRVPSADPGLRPG